MELNIAIWLSGIFWVALTIFGSLVRFIALPHILIMLFTFWTSGVLYQWNYPWLAAAWAAVNLASWAVNYRQLNREFA